MISIKVALSKCKQPQKVKGWFHYGEQITGTRPHAPELADHLKAKGLTMAGFLRVYNVRIRGGDVEVFHLERDYEELRRMMARREELMELMTREER